jgi:endoglucanase
MFVNANADAYLGYSGWAAGAFSPTTYNLTETPIGSAGNFTDQPIVAQCIVGTHTAGGIASKRDAVYRARMVRRAV